MMALYTIVMLWGYADAYGSDPCAPNSCASNETHPMCNSNVTGTAKFECVACLEDTDCADGLTCHVGECKQVCDSAKMCPLEMPVCATVTTSELATTTSSSAGSYGANKPTSFCTSCKDDTDCSRFQNTGAQHVCSNGACTKCDANAAYPDSKCMFLDDNAQCGEENFRMCGKGFACQKAAVDDVYGAKTGAANKTSEETSKNTGSETDGAESSQEDVGTSYESTAPMSADTGSVSSTDTVGGNIPSSTTAGTPAYQTDGTTLTTTAVVPTAQTTSSTKAPAESGPARSPSLTPSPSIATTNPTKSTTIGGVVVKDTRPKEQTSSNANGGSGVVRRLEAGTAFCMKQGGTDFTGCTCQKGVFPTVDENDEEDGKDGEEEGSNLMLIIIIAAVVAVVVLIIIVAVVLANKKKDVDGKNEVNFQPASTDSNRIAGSNRVVESNRSVQNHRGARRDGDRHRDANARAKNPNHANDSSSRRHVTLR